MKKTTVAALLCVALTAGLSSCASADRDGLDALTDQVNAIYEEAEARGELGAIEVHTFLTESLADASYPVETLLAYAGTASEMEYTLSVGLEALSGSASAFDGKTARRVLDKTEISVENVLAEFRGDPQWLVDNGFATADEAVKMTSASTNASAAQPDSWGEPLGWDAQPVPPGSLRHVTFSIGIDGSFRELDYWIEGEDEAGAKAWAAGLPRTGVSTHNFVRTLNGDTNVTLNSGAKVSPAQGLPAQWHAALPTGGFDYRFAGRTYEVRYDGKPSKPPVFHVTLSEQNRMDAYAAWIRSQPGWTVNIDDGKFFSASSADFEVTALSEGDGTDSVTITAMRWDVPGTDALRPDNH
ncbi:hypothetical protein F6J84_14740 [Microbacterium caowuchunii]|uniref:hypothetical protein n=1 Tax=Microbacterium caowuchunii TaxID=2614638 RepID=UPI0012492416|nr:hypothetical protein [Microbacterium caowuchunii]QEW01228.1 hypothetical protein F6J84_14740 [Microbacterium caowuchunii]